MPSSLPSLRHVRLSTPTQAQVAQPTYAEARFDGRGRMQ